MILHFVKCEMCEKRYQFDHSLQKPHERDVPDGWFKVFQSKDMPGQAGWDFCSKECLKRWASPPEDHEPYPFCCPRHYPMSITKQGV